LGQPRQAFSGSRGWRDGLFDQHVFPGGEQRRSYFFMSNGRSGDDRRINLAEKRFCRSE